MPSEKEP